MKVYVHHEAAPSFTKIVRVDPARHVQLRDVVEEFVRAFNDKHPTAPALSTEHLLLHDADHRPLQLAAKARKALTEHCDVFVVAHPAGAAAQGSSSGAAGSADAQQLQGNGSATAGSAGKPAEAVPGAAHSGASPSSTLADTGPADIQQERQRAAAVLQQYMSKAQQAAGASNFKLAGEIYTQLLELLPDEPELLVRGATLWLRQAGRPERALPLARRLAQVDPAACTAHELLGDCCMALDQPQEAVQHYDRALLAAKAAEAGDGHGSTASAAASPAARLNDLQVSMAQALYACGKKDEPALQDVAAKLVMGVLDRDESHWECLRLYAHIAEDQGLHADALRVALRLLVTRNTDAQVRALLARRLQAPGGVAALYEELGMPPPGSTGSTSSTAGDSSGASTAAGASAGASLAAGMAAAGSSSSGSSGSNSGAAAGVGGGGKGGANNASALAFLAMCVKDHGAVDATIELLEKAVSLDPLHAGYALNLAHAWELQQRLDKVVQVAAAGLGRAGHPRVGGGTDLQACAALPRSLPPLQPPVTSLAWRDAAPWQPQPSPPAADAAPPAADSLAASTAALALSHSQSAPSSAAATGSSDSSPFPKVQYSSTQLDLLALAFTAIKALFVGGALSTAARLVSAILPARDASQQPLHTTLIRNEAAYFGCVLLLVTSCPPPAYLPPGHIADDDSHQLRSQGGTAEAGAPGGAGQEQPEAGSAHVEGAAGRGEAGTQEGSGGGAGVRRARPLYLLGDSHCLSAAWHVVALRGEQRLLHPVLVTGCKVWHLRGASSFYPKAQYQSSVAALPPGSQLVVLLGEIDCREGLLLAVQKCKYASLAEGVDATLRIYLDEVLLHLVQDRRCEVFVHPVPPVLNETRAVVTLYNQALKAKVLAAATQPPFQGRLHYLDLFSDLLTADGTALAPGLHFDGTHLSPSYVPLLARELAAIK